MEYLAYLHSALVYEESLNFEVVSLLPKINLFDLLKQQKYICKAWLYSLSLSLTLVLIKMSSSVLALQMKEQGYQTSNLASSPISQVAPKQKLANKTLISNLSYRPIQKHRLYIKGKLYLVNDTPYIAFFLLYKPGHKEPNRYANIRPCTQVILSSRYSNLWRVNLNGQHRQFFIDNFYKKNKNIFEIKTSQINQIANQKQSCQTQKKLTGIQLINATEVLAPVDAVELLPKALDAAEIAIKNAEEFWDFTKLAKAGDELNLAFFNMKIKWGMKDLPDEDVIKIKNIVEETRNSKMPPQEKQRIINCISILLGYNIEPNKFSEFSNDFLKYNQVEKDYNWWSKVLAGAEPLINLVTSTLRGGQLSEFSKQLENCRKGASISFQVAFNPNRHSRCTR